MTVMDFQALCMLELKLELFYFDFFKNIFIKGIILDGLFFYKCVKDILLLPKGLNRFF